MKIRIHNPIIGVPITFMNNFSPEQFKVIGIACGNSWGNYKETLKKLNFNPEIKYGGGLGTGVIDGKACYTRIFVQKKRCS